MNNEIDDSYITEALSQLEAMLGVREEINHAFLIRSFFKRDIEKFLKLIVSHLGLPIDIKITYVPKGYKANSDQAGFESTDLVRIDHSKKGSSGITAQVCIPKNLPFYGSPALDNFPIEVRISKDATENCFVFAATMAHEFSHVLLYSLRYIEKENEFHTDLTAMLMGFNKVTSKGRKHEVSEETITGGGISIKTTTTTYGYFTDAQFSFAHECITKRQNQKLLLKRDFLRLLREYKKIHFEYKNKLAYFSKCFKYLDNNLKQKIRKEDGQKLVYFHQPDYFSNQMAASEDNEKNLRSHEIFYRNLTHFTGSELIKLKALKYSVASQKQRLTNFTNDLKVLVRYVSVKFRCRLVIATISWSYPIKMFPIFLDKILKKIGKAYSHEF